MGDTLRLFSRILFALSVLVGAADAQHTITVPQQTVKVSIPASSQTFTVPKNGGKVTITFPSQTLTIVFPAQTLSLPNGATFSCTGPTTNLTCTVKLKP